MGKVTIIVQHPKLPSSRMAEHLQRNSYGMENVILELEEQNIKPDVFVVPNDEEFPDLG